VDAMRRKLLRIRQLVSTGEAPHEDIEDVHTTLFNSVYIGLPPEADDLEGDALLAAIDEQLEEGDETASQGSWQTLEKLHIPSSITGAVGRQQEAKPSAKRLARSKRPSIQFCFSGIEAEHDIYPADTEIASRLLVTAKNVEILDHIKTSTWRKFLTQMREDSRGNVRETDSNMLRIELVNVRPVAGDPSEETRLRVSLPFTLELLQLQLYF
jgi:autophagy-related protein 2